MSEDNPKMVPAGAVLEASKGMLQRQFYAIFTTPTDGLGPVFAVIEEHLKFQVELESRGILHAAGPMWTDDEQSWEGEGMVIVRAASRDEAIKIAESDPMHKSGARTFRVRPWLVNEGSTTVTLNYSTQSFTID